MPLTPRQMKKLYSEIAVIVMILIVALTVGVLLYKNKVKDTQIEELKRKSYAHDIRDSIVIDSLKFKILQDSLHIVDLQRVNYINNINQQDNEDKGKHDLIITIIPTADDKQRDRLWATYSPKN